MTTIPRRSMGTFTDENGLTLYFVPETAGHISLGQTNVDLERTGTVPLHPLGTIAVFGNKSFVYVETSAAILLGEFVEAGAADTFYEGSKVNGTTDIPLGVAVVAMAANSYGWVQYHGLATVEFGADASVGVVSMNTSGKAIARPSTHTRITTVGILKAAVDISVESTGQVYLTL